MPCCEHAHDEGPQLCILRIRNRRRDCGKTSEGRQEIKITETGRQAQGKLTAVTMSKRYKGFGREENDRLLPQAKSRSGDLRPRTGATDLAQKAFARLGCAVACRNVL